MSSRRTRAVLAAIGLAAALAAGCASIPDATQVEVVGPDEPNAGPGTVAAAPEAGLKVTDVVREWVNHSQQHADKYAAARGYLTSEAAGSWRTAEIYVIDNQFETIPEGAANGNPDEQLVRLDGQRRGRLAGNGVFAADRQQMKLLLKLVREGGEWRISDPPPLLLITISHFRVTYRTVSLAFVDPVRGVLVRDSRWVRRQPADGLAGRVIDLLLLDLPAELTNALANELAGASTHTNVALDEDDVLRVDLTGIDLHNLDRRARGLIAAQVVASLQDVAGGPVRIMVDGSPLVREQTVWQLDDVQRFIPDLGGRASLPVLVATGGRLLQLDTLEALPGTDELDIRAVTQSLSGAQLGVVVQDESTRKLLVGPPGGLVEVPLAASPKQMTVPTWRRDGKELWTVLDGANLVAVVPAGEGSADPPRAFNVDVSAFTRLGRIDALRVSRDGVRVAAAVGGKLMLGTVVGSSLETGVAVSHPRELVPQTNSGPEVVNVVWNNPEKLTVITAGGGSLVYDVRVDGLEWTPYATVNLSPPINAITAAPSKPVLVADTKGLWSVSGTGGAWDLIEGVDPGSAPAYPG